MPTYNYTILFNHTPGSLGTLIEYRKSTETNWTTPSSPPNPTTLDYYTLSLEGSSTYYIRLSPKTSTSCTPKYIITVVTTPGSCCPDGYTLAPDGTYCYIIDTIPPNIIQSNICLAPSQRIEYSDNGTKLFTSGYDTDLTTSFTLLSTITQWKSNSSSTGPMNRNGVWVDTDCNGSKDGLTAGQLLQFTVPISTSVPITVYIGIGGDNTFSVDLNGTLLAEKLNPVDTTNFNFWYLFPVNIPSGTSYFHFQGVGDGTVNDAFASVIYGNTGAELASATSDADLNILFQTSDLIGQHIDIADECPFGYFLDTSGGVGNYECIRVTSTAPSACESSTTTTTTTLIPVTMHVTNTLAGTIIEDVTGFTYTILSGSFPIAPGGDVEATHVTFTGSISVDISGTPFGDGNLSIYKNAILLDCQAVPGAGTYTSSIHPFNSTDIITISLNSGTC